MDFSTKGQQVTRTDLRRPAPTNQAGHHVPQRTHEAKPQTPPLEPRKNKEPVDRSVWMRGWIMLLMLSIAGLIIAVAFYISIANRPDANNLVNSKSLQVVEVANDNSDAPVFYYGNISAIRSGYIVLNNAYKLTSPEDVTPVSVLPVSCSATNASSQIVINRHSVILWNNVAEGSSIAQTIQQQTKSGGCPSTTSVNQEKSDKTSGSSQSSDSNKPTGSQPTNKPTQTEPNNNNQTPTNQPSTSENKPTPTP